MTRSGRFVAFATIALAAVLSLPVLPVTPSAAASVYDSRITERLKVKSSQRAAVARIAKQGRRDTLKIFRKYGIDPNAKPDFDKLMKASSELQTVQRRQREEMKRVLTPEQLQQYDRIIEETRARVMKASR